MRKRLTIFSLLAVFGLAACQPSPSGLERAPAKAALSQAGLRPKPCTITNGTKGKPNSLRCDTRRGPFYSYKTQRQGGRTTVWMKHNIPHSGVADYFWFSHTGRGYVTGYSYNPA